MDSDPIPQLKQQLLQEILVIANRYTVSHAGYMLGIGTPRMSHLRKGNLERFSLEKLIRILAHVDRRIELHLIDESGPANMRRALEVSAKRRAVADVRRGGS